MKMSSCNSGFTAARAVVPTKSKRVGLMIIRFPKRSAASARSRQRIDHLARPYANRAVPRREFLHQAAGAAVLSAAARIAMAQTYPSHPIIMIVPYAPGGANDVLARIVAERMRGPLGQPVIIENVAGADGSIGVGRAARARADGYTIDLGSAANHALNGAFYTLQYDLLNDFAPISPLGAGP